MNSEILTEPVIEYGFAGLCAVQLTALIWLVAKLLEILRDTAEVIANNTAALKSLKEQEEVSTHLFSDLRDRILSRPCLRIESEWRKRASHNPTFKKGPDHE